MYERQIQNDWSRILTLLANVTEYNYSSGFQSLVTCRKDDNLTNKEALTVLCSVVKHAGSG